MNELLRRRMMLQGSESVDWEEVGRGMVDYTTPFTVVLPDGLTKVNDQMFYGRSNLTGHIEIPQSVTEIGTGAFTSTGITSVSFGQIVKFRVSSFAYCLQLAIDLVIPDSTTLIDSYAFRNTPLIGLTIGSGVTVIGGGAFFYSLGNVDKVVVKATTPPTVVHANAFGGFAGDFYVPDGSVNAYKAASEWSTWASRIYPISDLTA